MGTNTLINVTDGVSTVAASDTNNIHTALNGSFVGRNSSGVPTAGQQLGTSVIPWGEAHLTSLFLNGVSVDASLEGLLSNRVVSGATRTGSSQPDFIRPTGSGLNADILATATDLKIVINNVFVTISADINLTSLTAAPATNNTCLVNDTSLSGGSETKYIGERESILNIDTAGSEITALVGQIVAFKTATSEIMVGYLKSATQFVQAYRGYLFDSSGDPIVRETISNNDTLTLLKLGWVFVEDDGTTAEVVYTTPSYAYEEPASPATGDYWLDQANAIWKRYDGGNFVQIDRTLIGVIANDTTTCLGARSLDPFAEFSDVNNLELTYKSVTEIKTKDNKGEISIYNLMFSFKNNELVFDITADLESPLTEAANTTYYLYLSKFGQRIISTERPYLRNDLKGLYHPYHTWRCIGQVLNNASSNLENPIDFSQRLILKTYDVTTTTPTTASSFKDRINIISANDAQTNSSLSGVGAIARNSSDEEAFGGLFVQSTSTDGQAIIRIQSSETTSTVNNYITCKAGNVAIGEEVAPIAKLHIFTGDSGLAGAINAGADELLLEGNGITGMSIISPSANQSQIIFGDNTDNSIHYIRGYASAHATQAGQLEIYNNNAIACYFDSTQNLHVNADIIKDTGILDIKSDDSSIYIGDLNAFVTEYNTPANTLYLDSTGNIGIGETSPLGKFHIYSSNSGVASVSGAADDLVIESSAATGATIIFPATGTGTLAFGDTTDSASHFFRGYGASHATLADYFRLYVNASIAIEIDGSQNVEIPTGQFKPTGGIKIANQSEAYAIKRLDIGDWDMDTNNSVNVAHGLTASNIIDVTVIIRDDTPNFYYNLIYGSNQSDTTLGGGWTIGATNITLFRTDATSGGKFDHPEFDSTSYNRGTILITYKV